MISIRTEKRFGKMEHGTKDNGTSLALMEKAFILTGKVMYTRVILWITIFKAKANILLLMVQYTKATSKISSLMVKEYLSNQTKLLMRVHLSTTKLVGLAL